MNTLNHQLILQPDPDTPETALPLVLGPVLAASGVTVVVETSAPLPGDTGLMQGSNLSFASIGQTDPAGYRTVPVAPLIPDRDWPACRSLGQLRFHEAAAVLAKQIQDGPLIMAMRQAGAAILAELGMWEMAIAYSVIDGAWSSGTAGERFTEALGASALDTPDTCFPVGRQATGVFAPRRGTIAGWRHQPLAQALDTAGTTASITHLAPPGTRPGPRQAIARIWTERPAEGAAAARLVQKALLFS